MARHGWIQIVAAGLAAALRTRRPVPALDPREGAHARGVRPEILDSGQEIPPAEQQNPDALRAHHKAEMEKWTPIIKAANIKVQ